MLVSNKAYPVNETGLTGSRAALAHITVPTSCSQDFPYSRGTTTVSHGCERLIEAVVI